MRAWFSSGKIRTALLVLVLLVLVFLGLKFWLTSGIGRGMVESRLSSALGRPVSLSEDFSIDLLPVPGASGTGLKILSEDGRWLVLEAGSYLAQLALGPLLKGEVEVVAFRVGDASVDLPRMLQSSGESENRDQPFAGLPAIRRFSLSDVRLFFSGMNTEPHVRIDELEVRDLYLGGQAEFDASFAVHSDDADLAELAIAGHLVLADSGQMELGVSALDVTSGDWLIDGIAGSIDIDLPVSRLSWRLQWEQGAVSVSSESRVNWNPGFAEQQPGYSVEAFLITVQDQHVEGSGCVLEKERFQLNLDLAAKSLVLDDLREVLDSWRPKSYEESVSQAGELMQSLEDVESDLEIPFDLAVTLAVEQADFGDLVAEGISLQLGSRPACPDGV